MLFKFLTLVSLLFCFVAVRCMQRCEKFKYGGCGGVAPFKNKKDCKNAYCHQYMFPVLGTAS